MSILRRLFDLYLQASIHVGLSVYALVRITEYILAIPHDGAISGFAFFGAIAGYNFVKYDALAKARILQMNFWLKAIVTLSFCSFLLAGLCFLNFEFKTRIYSAAFLLLTVLYTLSFFPNRRNARNWAGVKIYIVAICWVGVTVILPVINSGIVIATDFYIECIRRFLLIFVLVLIFDILDLAKDDPHLRTVPQQIGVNHTKILGSALLVVFYILAFFIKNYSSIYLCIEFLLIVAIGLFLFFANDGKSKYYTAFWVESIPIFWWLAVCASTFILLH